MDIGILDCEAILYPRQFFPNLDVMKIAAYHKRKRDYTTLILDIEKMARYSTIYFRKEKNDGRFPPGLLTDNRCKYGGAAFTGNRYISLGKEIDNIIPDIGIYDKFFKYRMNYGLEKIVDSWRRSNFLRLSSNEKDYDIPLNIYVTGVRPGLNYLYDRKLICLTDAIEDLKNSNKKYTCLYTQRSDNIEDILKWIEAGVLNAHTKIIYEGRLENKDIYLYSARTKECTNRILIPYWTNKDALGREDKNYVISELIPAISLAIYSYVTKTKIYPYYEYDIRKTGITNALNMFNVWTTSFMGAYSYYDIVCENNGKKIIDELCERSRELRELANIKPKKIRENGGIWVL